MHHSNTNNFGEVSRATLALALGAGQWHRWLLVVLAVLVFTGCAAQRIRDQSQVLLNQGQYEAAVTELEQGLQAHPNSPVLRAGLIQAKDGALRTLVSAAAAAKALEKWSEAQALLQRALPFDGGSGRVPSLLLDLDKAQRQQRALSDALALREKKQNKPALEAIAEGLKHNPKNAELLALQRRIELDVRAQRGPGGRIALRESRPISLDFRNASLHTVLSLITRHSGVNFILDKDLSQDTRVTLHLQATPVEQAIELLAQSYQLSQKVLDEQTVLVYPNTPQKQKEHQEQVVKVFYLTSADVKGAAVFLRSMLGLRDPFIDERSNMLAMRDSAEQVALAERLISLYDTPEPEVLLEVEVIEISASRLTDLGIKFPDSFSLTPLSSSGGTQLRLDDLKGLNTSRVGVGLGGILVNAKREVGDYNTLANPRIRTRNRVMARVMIGDKIPVITTTTGTGGFISESVNYLDVGLKLEVEPTVYADDEVSMKLALEVSSLGSQVRSSTGTIAYQIGTRNATTTLRLRDGETQLLAGLISREDRSASNRLPGVGDLPVLGRLFSSDRDESNRKELVLAITPRILRNLRRPEANETELFIGTEAAPRLRPAGPVVPDVASEANEVKVNGSPD